MCCFFFFFRVRNVSWYVYKKQSSRSPNLPWNAQNKNFLAHNYLKNVPIFELLFFLKLSYCTCRFILRLIKNVAKKKKRLSQNVFTAITLWKEKSFNFFFSQSMLSFIKVTLLKKLKKLSRTRIPFSDAKKGFFFCYEHAEGKKTCYFAFWRNTLFVMRVKKEEKVVIGKKTRTKTCYCNKTTKSFCYFTKKNLNCPCLKSFISNERRKSLKNNFSNFTKILWKIFSLGRFILVAKKALLLLCCLTG